MTTNKTVQTVAIGNDTIITVEFCAAAKDVREASVLFRQAIGAVPSLNNSLLGGHPTCAREMRLDICTHQVVRRFKDEEGLRDYVDYLEGLLERAPDYAPSLERFEDDQGFRYATHLKRATIGIRGVQNGWSVGGKANFVNPDIAARNLARAGFKVRCESAAS